MIDTGYWRVSAMYEDGTRLEERHFDHNGMKADWKQRKQIEEWIRKKGNGVPVRWQSIDYIPPRILKHRKYGG